MEQEQQSIVSIHPRNGPLQSLKAQRLLSCFLIGLGVTCVLTILEILIFIPFHILAVISHTTVFFLIPLLELIGISFLFFFIAEPWAVVRYLRAVHRAQKEYHDLYIPLTALANIRTHVETEHEGFEEPELVVQEERISILDLVQQEEQHQLILGLPGAGKTTALRVYQYSASQYPVKLLFARGKIPVYIPMKNYSLFLKHQQPEEPLEEGEIPTLEETLLPYLEQSDLPGMRRLRRSLPHLFAQGRLLFLCDGLNEVDPDYLKQVCNEITDMMSNTSNRFVITCREVDYREQSDFVQLVEVGGAVQAVIHPLQPEQVYEFIERYVSTQDDQWQSTADRIMQVIDRSRLRYHCTNPMMLFTLMRLIDHIGLEQEQQIDTRGQLLREYVHQLIVQEQDNPRWNFAAPAEQDILGFLSELASAARWGNDRNAIQLRSTSSTTVLLRGGRQPVKVKEVAADLRDWLTEHPAYGPFISDERQASQPYEHGVELLQFALSAALIEVSPDGALSFRHELIAEYFVAEFFVVAAPHIAPGRPLRVELFQDVARWSEPVAIWAGLLDDPLQLAACFGTFGVQHREYLLQALTLGLVCVGVLWTPPQAEVQHAVALPAGLADALTLAVQKQPDREELARFFTRAAEEGGQEVYRSLLPLITIDGVDDLLVLLDKNIVPDILFTQLEDAVDEIAYDVQVKRIARVLGRFGDIIIDRAAQLTLPAPERSLRLRAAAINTLGGTNEILAVEPLMARLSDADMFIVGRATNALFRLGPMFVLSHLFETLDQVVPGDVSPYVPQAILTILAKFLDEQDPQRQLTLTQYQQCIEHMLPLLGAKYEMLVVIQEQVHEILVRQGRHATRIVSPTVNDNRWEQAIERAIQHLSSQDELMVHNIVTILQEIGSPAVPPLLSQLKSANETVQLAIVDILHTVRDMQSLPVLLTLLGDTSPAIQQRVAQTLRHFAPESIASLIDLVLHGPDDTVADRTAQILISIGESVVGSIIEVLSNVVPGRTRFLVQVLALIRDPRAVPALVSLLEQPQLEPLLVIAIIRALCQFPDKRVVTPLLSVLTNTNPQLYEEAITALSQLGEIALPGLIAELDVENETVVIPRVRRAILGISPFAGTMLIDALEHGSQGQSMQIMQVFKARGRDGAQMLVQHLLHQDERVRTLIHETLQQMPGTITVPALMSVLGRAELNDVVSTFLLRYPDAAIDPLVALLGEDERGSLVAELLPQFGAAALRPLLVGLDDSRDIARERARKAIVKLIRQKRGKDQRPLLQEALQLFHPQPVQRVREALLQIWSTDLANIGVPTLLDGLEDAYLIEDVAEIFVRLCRKPAQQEAILDQLIASLSNEKLRLGAEIALIRIGAPSVGRIGELIVHEDSGLEKAARYILGEIGVPALSFIWTAYSDRNNAERREAARAVFHSMPPEMIKDELVALLVSDNRDDISMAMSLLIERIHEEMSQLNYVDQVMVPELIKYVQTYQVEETNLRIIALLLLLGEQTIVDHLLQALTEHPSSQRQLLYAFLLMSSQTQQGLLNVFSNPSTPAALRVDIATILSMTITPAVMVDYARNISMYGLSGTTAATRKEYFSSDQLAISLRALGGLLASGQWDAQTLHQLLDMTAEDDPAREVFNILLGWRYEPQIAKLKYDLEAQRDTLMKEMTVLVASVNDKQSTINRLEAELEKFHDEHDLDEEELKLVTHEKDTLHASVEKLMRENKDLRLKLEQTTRMRDKLASQYQALMRQQGGAGDMPGSSSPSNQATPSRPSQVPRSR